MLNRRSLLAGAAALPLVALARRVPAAAATLPGLENASMRGSIDSLEFGVRPGALDDQSRVFARMLEKASDTDTPVFLPAGTYVVSNLVLPRRVRLSGVPGATRIVYGGDGHLMLAEATDLIDISGILFDGANRWIGDQAQGLLDFRRVAELSLRDCRILGSGRNGISLERVAGRIEASAISGAAEAGIYSVEAAGLTIAGNTVSDCANGGILVHRWQAADDGTIVTGNRVERIAARSGGTGQFGNGINVFRANGVLVGQNSVSDCAFSAIRANSSSNLRVVGNSALRSGETALYAEFAFDGAVFNANIVDGAANGISVVNFDEGGRMATLTGNIVRNLSATGPYRADPPGFGVGITVEADCAVTGNLVENAPLHGIAVGWGAHLRNVAATGNVVRRAGTGIAVSVAPGAGHAIISDNLIDEIRFGGVVGYEWTRPVTGDLAVEGARGWPNLTVERNRVS
ncbi:MAG TPA: TIGR03808 family TAT-translocated repetitive protein [Rhizobiales bacterium]|nr:TIGR03808 family TAT-translocated repetitive protein [Hyphomicrobiales bacterium]